MLPLHLIESLPYKPTADAMQIRVCCPECDDEKFHMYVHTGKNVYHCFKCGASGKVIDTDTLDLGRFKKLSQKDFRDALEAFEKAKPEPKRTLPIRKPITAFNLEYLQGRGISSS